MRRRWLVAALACGAGGIAVARSRDDDPRPCRAATVQATEHRGASPDTGLAAVANQFSGTVSLVRLPRGERTDVDVTGSPHDVAISADGRWAASADFGERGADGQYGGNVIDVIEVAAGRVVRRIPTGVDRGLHDLQFLPSGQLLVTAQGNRAVIIVDVERGQVLRSIGTQGERSHLVAVSSDGRWAYTTNEGTADVSRIDLASGRTVGRFPSTPNVEGIVLADGDRDLWVGEAELGRVRVVDAASGEGHATFDGFRYPNRIAVSSDGRTVVISDPGCRTLTVADARRRAVVSVIGVDVGTMAGAVSADGRRAVAAQWDRTDLVVIDLAQAVITSRVGVGRGADGVSWFESR